MQHLMFYNREDRPWPNERLKRAAIVGHTTESSVRLWIRVREVGIYWLIVSKHQIPTSGKPSIRDDSAGKPSLVVIGDGEAETLFEGLLISANFTNDTDRTNVFDVGSLDAGTPYYYAIFPNPGDGKKDPWEVGKDSPHFFATKNPAADTATFGLISCHMPYDKKSNLVNMDMWDMFGDTLAEYGANFIVAGGDQVYSDGTPEISIWNWLKRCKEEMTVLSSEQRQEIMTSWYRDIYRGYWGPVALRKVFRRFPTYMMWDDHEIMDGWGSYTDSELSNELDSMWEWENEGENLALAHDMFDTAKRVYGEYQHSHNPPTAPDQWDYAFNWGPCAFFALDMRGHRKFGRKDNAILGNAQMARFQKWIKSEAVINAQALFIVSPVPVVHAAEFIVNHMDLNILGLADDLRDEWDHDSNWDERDKILDAAFEFSQNEGKTVAFLSGDVHIGAAFKLSRKGQNRAKVYQLTSSAITYHLSNLKRNALELIVRKKGTLSNHAHKPKEEKTNFSLIHIQKRNNFGIIQATRDEEGKTRVYWDLFANTPENDEVMKMKRIEL